MEGHPFANPEAESVSTITQRFPSGGEAGLEGALKIDASQSFQDAGLHFDRFAIRDGNRIEAATVAASSVYEGVLVGPVASLGTAEGREGQ